MPPYQNDTLHDASFETAPGGHWRRLPPNEHSVENIPPRNENETFLSLPQGPQRALPPQLFTAEEPQVHSTWISGHSSIPEYLARSGQLSQQDSPVLPDHVGTPYPDHVGPPYLAHVGPPYPAHVGPPYPAHFGTNYRGVHAAFSPTMPPSDPFNPFPMTTSGHPPGVGFWQDAPAFPTVPISQTGDYNPYTTTLPMEESFRGALNTDPDYKCPRCHKDFTRKWNRDQHVKDVHDGRRRFHCDQCGHPPFSRKHDLDRHVKRVHRPAESPL